MNMNKKLEEEANIVSLYKRACPVLDTGESREGFY
jgi:hypothetical protein